jgi:hypothetical protein
MSKSQTFRARALNYNGIETSSYIDQWGGRQPKVERVAPTVGLRVVTHALLDKILPDYAWAPGRPKSALERWMNQTDRGIRIDLNADEIEIEGSGFWNAVDFNDHRRRPRTILRLSALGVVPEFNDHKVFVEAGAMMLHRPSMQELDCGVFVNDVRITPYVNADPRS